MEFLSQNIVEGSDFLFSKVIFLPGCITYEIQEQLEEWTFKVWCSIIRWLVFTENLNYRLQSMLQVQRTVVRCDQLIRYDDQLWVVLNKRCIDRLMVGRYRVLYPLQRVNQTVLEEVTNLILRLVKDLL